MFALDIETIPNDDMVAMLPEPELKLGNVKDQAKIEAKKTEAKQKQIENMALNPFYGRVCSWAVYGDDGVVDDVASLESISDVDEYELVSLLFRKYLAQTSTAAVPQIVTWNGSSFDFPFLFKRAMMLDISKRGLGHVRPLGTWVKRYSTTPHCDLMQVYTQWYGHLKLDTAASVLLGEGKAEYDFRQNAENIRTGNQKELEKYNMRDAELTYQLAERAAGYLW